MKIISYVICGPGQIRVENQDNYYINGVYRKNPTDGSVRQASNRAQETALYAVADGMGGESSGELASLIAVMAMENVNLNAGMDEIQRCLLEGNAAICQFIRDNGNIRSGSTFVGLGVCGAVANIVNIGDSRAYLLRDGQLRQLSKDHTSVQQMLEMGIISPESARKHPARHRLTQHLGIFPDELIIEPYLVRGTVAPGDLFLLCSDGLYDMVDDDQIQWALTMPGTLQKKAEHLFDTAMQAGGKDNITILLVSIETGGAE